MTNEEIQIRLYEMADKKFQEFSSALIPGCTNMIGVRIPNLRLLAKEIVKGDWRGYLEEAGEDTFEELMLQGIVIGGSKCGIEEKISLAEKFIPKIRDWSVNDVFCSCFKCAGKNQERVFEFLMPYVTSEHEFEQRVVAVMLMDYFLTEEYIHQVLQVLNELKHEGYYTKMGIAWATATAYAKFPRETYVYLTEWNTLDDFTFNKAIQKMTESYRVPQEDKEMLRRLKRK
ncbi:MAG: DNA alkylation repair protein [Lachnospiraceae bacterium]|nr:DNA alkylation repair protein [Lachnospiraceae bacterium]